LVTGAVAAVPGDVDVVGSNVVAVVVAVAGEGPVVGDG
jgi:hypothetical protein